MSHAMTLDTEQRESTLVGERVRKCIGKQRVFWGNIFALYHISNATFYKVLFDDGDVDIFSTEEISKLLADAKTYKIQDTKKKQSTSDYTQEIRTHLLDKYNTVENTNDVRHIKLWDSRLYAAIICVNDKVIIRNFSRKPYANSPKGELEKSGKVKIGDIIVAINYNSVKGKGIEEISNIIRETPRPMILSVMSPHDYDIKYPKKSPSNEQIVSTTQEIEPEPTPPESTAEKKINLPVLKDIVQEVVITKPKLYSVIISEQNKIVLKGFADMENGQKGEIESSQKVKIGDILVSVNQTNTRGMNLKNFSSFISTLKRPFVVSFVSPSDYDKYMINQLQKSHQMVQKVVEPSPKLNNNIPAKTNPMRQTTLTSMPSQTATHHQKMMTQNPSSFAQSTIPPQNARWFIRSPIASASIGGKPQASGTSQHLTIPQSGSSILSGPVQRQSKPLAHVGSNQVNSAPPFSSFAVPVLSSRPGIPPNSFLSPSSANFVNFLPVTTTAATMTIQSIAMPKTNSTTTVITQAKGPEPTSTPPVPNTTTATTTTTIQSVVVPKTTTVTTQAKISQPTTTPLVPTTTKTATTQQSIATPKTNSTTTMITQAKGPEPTSTPPVPNTTTATTTTTIQSVVVPKTTTVTTQAKVPQPTTTPSKSKVAISSKPNIAQSKKIRSLPKQSSMLNRKRHVVRITKQQLMVAIGKMRGRSALASFIHGDDGEKGEIEASGKVLYGDFLVQVNDTPIARDKTPAQVAHILMKTPRPFEITFERSSEPLVANS